MEIISSFRDKTTVSFYETIHYFHLVVEAMGVAKLHRIANHTRDLGLEICFLLFLTVILNVPKSHVKI